MKTIFLSVFFLLLAVGLNAQKFVYEQIRNSVVIKNENSDSLLKPYRDKGNSTQFNVINYRKQQKWFAQFKNDVLPESVNEKIKTVPGYIGVNLYFNGQGEVIDAYFMISLTVYEKLTETEICSMYSRLMKIKMDMDMLSWDGNFNYSLYSSLIKKSNSN